MPEVRLPVEVVAGVPVVTTPEEIDVANAAAVQAALGQAAGHGHPTVVVDMSETRFCDSAGLHVLVRAHKKAQAAGGEVLLVLPATPVLRIFSITGIDRLIPHCPSLGEALSRATPAPSADTSAPAPEPAPLSPSGSPVTA